MNVIPKLGIKLLRANGQLISGEFSQNTNIACAQLVQATTIPARKVRFQPNQVSG